MVFLKKNQEIPSKLKILKHEIFDQLNKEPKTRWEITQAISLNTKLDIREIIPSIDYLLYHNILYFDISKKISNETKVYKTQSLFQPIIPLYLYFQQITLKNPIQYLYEAQTPFALNIDERDPNYDSKSQREFLALPEKTQQMILERKKHLEISSKDEVNTQVIKKYAENNKIHLATLYRWRKLFQESGWIGLIPKKYRSGRIKRVAPLLNTLINKIIEERYLSDIQPSITGCYKFLLIECKKHGIKPCDRETFRKRVNEVSRKKKFMARKGKKVTRDTFQLLDGEFPFGNHPMDGVEFDHSELDIMLVDQVDRAPIGRPTLTLAVDSYSRMVYGYYLSFDPPSHLALGMCFLNGILPKTHIIKNNNLTYNWPICGIPKRIIIDNAMEFRGHSFMNFYQQKNIEVIFNPVKTPNFKPYVERLIKTINESIRDENIPGYVLPLSEKRKTQYNPEKNANLTLDEFEKWLLHWIVEEYHPRMHQGIELKEFIKISPLERFENGLLESEFGLVGLTEVPDNIEQLKYDVLAFKKRKISREGIKIFGLEYQSPIISELLDLPESASQKYIIRYDPRDIREIYPWVESMQLYYPIPIKDAFINSLNIDQTQDFTLSKIELDKIKKNKRSEINGRSLKVNPHDLATALDKRQEIIAQARNKTKTAKRARRNQEIIINHTKSATSTQIRKERNEIDMKDSESLESIPVFQTEPESEDTNISTIGDEKIEAFPIESNWED